VNWKHASPFVENFPSAVPPVPDATGCSDVVLKWTMSFTWIVDVIGLKAKVAVPVTVTVAAGVAGQVTDFTLELGASIVLLLLPPQAATIPSATTKA
jgi:hypothetical protein